MKRRQRGEAPEKEQEKKTAEAVTEETVDETVAPEQTEPAVEEEALPDIEPDEAEEEISAEQAEIERLNEELSKQKELYLRLAAEYDNFRKRTSREKLALSDSIKSDCVAALLPVIDNIERALDASNADADSMRKGVEMVMSQTNTIFEKLGVCSFGKPGDSFDPNFHHCVSTAQSEEYSSGQIILVMQKGYMLGDKVIRPAMVQTAE